MSPAPASGSLQLISVKEVYRQLMIFTTFVYDKLHSAKAKLEIQQLNTYLHTTWSSSSAMINNKLGLAILSLSDHLFQAVSKQMGDLYESASRNWIEYVASQEQTCDYVDQQIVELGSAVPVIISTMVRQSTGQTSKHRIVDELFPPPVKDTKFRKKKLIRMVSKITSQISGPESTTDLRRLSAPLPDFDVLSDLSEVEIDTFLATIMNVGAAIFGPVLGPKIGLQYSASIFFTINEVVDQCQKKQMREIRSQRLKEKLSKLLAMADGYQAVTKASQSEIHIAVSKNFDLPTSFDDSIQRRTLRYDLLQQLGDLISNSIASLPEDVLQKCVNSFSSKEESSNTYRTDPALIETSGDQETRNLKALSKKVTEFDGFLQSLDIVEQPPASLEPPENTESFSSVSSDAENDHPKTAEVAPKASRSFGYTTSGEPTMSKQDLSKRSDTNVDEHGNIPKRKLASVVSPSPSQDYDLVAQRSADIRFAAERKKDWSAFAPSESDLGSPRLDVIDLFAPMTSHWPLSLRMDLLN
ncbi:hypothetical protein RvY_18634 [Ramazzottius varieornatus]|uniref:Uncharacterized protein n=1 Tax=Ramazzottius varieornatus TaxID=947166 RepID=A0A1D1W6I6_RAMVA|nr:hypothetical protein RvY_18634 [Ramazzottius varieornatus]